MFKAREIQDIDTTYFEVLHISAYNIKLKSKNTKHTWIIYCCMINENRRSLVVYHSHKEYDPPHIQLRFHPHSVIEAQHLIIDHDKWHLLGRKKRR